MACTAPALRHDPGMKALSLRSDARQNRASLLEAANTVFGRHGFDAPLELVAAEAGISRTTLYRNFADREALGVAIFERNVAELEVQAAAMNSRDDAVIVLLDTIMDHFVASAGLADALHRQTRTRDDMGRLRQRVIDLLAPLLARAQAAGLIRPAFQVGDLDMIMRMMAGGLGDEGEETRQARADSVRHVLFDGLVIRR